MNGLPTADAYANHRMITVGIAELAVSADVERSIITHALGSCIAVVLYEPKLKLAGMLHFMLPGAKGASEPGRSPLMFADTGVPLLFEAMYKIGAKKHDLVVKLAGGASMEPGTDMFDIGRRNHLALRKILFKNSVLIAAEDVGGSVSRTVWIEVGTGRLRVRTPEGSKDL